MPTCPKCRGEGKIVMSYRQTGYDPTLVPCPICKGSGRKPYYTPPGS